MIATIIPKRQKHYSVLLDEIISIITPQYGGTFIDCTLGQGGYTKKILEFSNTKIIALDRDKDTKKIALGLEKKFKNRFIFKNKKFSEINELDLKKEKIKAVIFDLGYSYAQIKDPKKGLSFNALGELNMKMGLNNFSAKDVINKLDEKDLEKIFKFFGEEKDAKIIASKIVKARKIEKIDTKILVKLIEKHKIKKNYKIHSATKTFQALRIFVNKEITELINGIVNATKVLKPGGKILVISFHSIEDKIVKYFFRNFSSNKSQPSRYVPYNNNPPKFLFCKYKNKILKPTAEEVKANPPSRSAKLRYAVRSKNNFFYPLDLIKKFQKYLDLENLNA